MQKKADRKRFVRYKEGAELYSMCQSKFLYWLTVMYLKSIWKHFESKNSREGFAHIF